MKLAVGGDDAHRPPYWATGKQAIDEFMGIRSWDQGRGVGKPKMPCDFGADAAPQCAEDHPPLIIGQTCCVIPGPNVSVPRDVRPVVMAMGGKMQTLRINAAEAGKCRGEVKGHGPGTTSHRVLENPFTG